MNSIIAFRLSLLYRDVWRMWIVVVVVAAVVDALVVVVCVVVCRWLFDLFGTLDCSALTENHNIEIKNMIKTVEKQ